MSKHKQHNYTKKVGINTIAQMTGKIITTATSLVLVAALTRYLGVTGYGQYTTIFAFVSFVATFADFGFFWVLVREIAKPKNDEQKIFNNVISLKIVFSTIIFTLGAIIAFLIPQYPQQLRIGIAIISVSWFWMSLNSTYVGLFQAKLEMYKAAITDVVGRIIILIGALIMIKLNYPLSSILWVYVFGNLVNFVISYILGQKFIHFKPTFNKIIWKMVLRESFPLAILSIVGLVNFKVDTIILSVMKGSEDVGIYGVPYKILEIVILIPSIFMGNVFPVLTKYFHLNDKRFYFSIQKTFDFLLLLSFPIVTGLSLLSKQIINFIAGEEYLLASTVSVAGLSFGAPQILIILSISIGITFIVTIFASLLTVIGKQSSQVWPMFVITMFNVVTNFIFIPKYSYVAASLTTLLSEIIMLAWWTILIKKYINININFNKVLPIFISSLVMGIFLYFTQNLNLLLVIILSIIIYFTVAYFMKAFDKETLKRILPKKIRTNNE